MEQNLAPVVTRKFWNIVRTMFFMLRKGILKGKLMAELNMIVKRGKIAGKAIQNLMFHHTHHWSSAAGRRSREEALSSSSPYPTSEDEYSCSNSPAPPHLPLQLNKRKKSHILSPSPAFPRFGKSPMVRQVRVTDSPFPLRDASEDHRVDEAAEKFIMKFYHNLRRQHTVSEPDKSPEISPA